MNFQNNMTELEDIFNQARMTPRSVYIETKNDVSVIYKGVKVLKDECGIKVLSTETEMYDEIRDLNVFKSKGFLIGVNDFLRKKYLKRLEELETLIGSEISNKRNHKKYVFLKGERNNLIEKYNSVKDE